MRLKTLYLDCFSGISGDMLVGALLDAGGDLDHLEAELRKMNIQDEYKLIRHKVVKNGITSTKFNVVLDAERDTHHPHDHEHEHTHEHTHHHEYKHHHHHDHEHAHEHTHHHGHDHNHEHTHHHHGHEHTHEHKHHHHRTYKDIVNLIESAGFSKEVEETALRVFKKIGLAEGHIHGIALDQVHFHEVGAVDSIVDIVGASILIHQLGIEKVVSSPIPVGCGKVHIDHGIYPVPAPATLEMLKGVPIENSEVRFELTTPTGAAVVSELAEEFGAIPTMRVTAIGYGAGTKTFKDRPNVLRVVIGD